MQVSLNASKYYRISFWGEKYKKEQQKEKKIDVPKKAAERQNPLNSEYFWFSILPSAGQLMS